MAISYPLNTPTNIGIANIAFTAENAVAISQSPFTYAQQVVSHPGQRWGASISLPPMKRQDAEYWVAFLLSLKGQAGTFLLGDPNCVAPQGSASARRNLLSYTEQYENAFWTKTGVTITTDAIDSPILTTTADKIVETAVTSTHAVLPSTFTYVSGVRYTYSIYVKAAERSWVYLQFASAPFGANTRAWFNLSTGVLGTVQNSVATITDAGDGWYRCTISATAIAGGTSSTPVVAAATTANGISSYLGVVGSGLYVWGSQLEVGPTATDYQSIFNTFGPFVNGANQVGDTLVIDGISPNVNGYLLPGDYIQLGTASSATLHKVLTQVNSNASGVATLDIWPSIRTAPADNAEVNITNTKGRFRLKENITQWQINEISSYGITFDCVEAI